MTENKYDQFDPSGVGVRNGKFIGLPFDYDSAALILMPVNWDATVSYRDGTNSGPDNILEASPQLDLYDPDAVDYWKRGIYFEESNKKLYKWNKQARKLARKHIQALESGNKANSKSIKGLAKVNHLSALMVNEVYESSIRHLKNGKLLALIGGDHSSPLGYYKALYEKFGSFGLLVIDAHLDLREAYEDFDKSHASIFYNTMENLEITKLIQVGIRDFCQEELNYIEQKAGKIEPYYDHILRDRIAKGETWHTICEEIVHKLPEQVVISVDIDGLLPYLCPNTGTPVAGGLEFQQVIYMIKTIVDKGKNIIGFDLCEVAGLPNEWDGNVGARMCYKLAGQFLRSQKWNEL
jgi:agmatinase